MKYQTITIDELAEHLVGLKKMGIATTVFLGAGVSASTGIPLANEIINILKKEYPTAILRNKAETYGEIMKVLPLGTRKEFIKKYTDNPKLNLAHLYLSSFVKHGYIDRILTTNFDPLAVKSLALNNIFPSVYDLAESKIFSAENVVDPSIFYIHGRYNGYYVLNTDEEISNHAHIVQQLFSDTNRKRCWIVIGYSGESDPLYKILSDIKEYSYGLYWIGYKNNPPSETLLHGVLQNKSAYYIEGHDADNFFIKLANKIGLKRPEIIDTPIELVKNIVLSVVDIEKDEKTVGITDKVLKELDRYSELSKNLLESEASRLIRQTRDLWIYEKYEEIDEVYTKVKESPTNEAKQYLSYAINNYILELRKRDNKAEIERQFSLLNALSGESVISHQDALRPVTKEYINPEEYPEFYSGTISTSGMFEAKRILKTDKIRLIGKRVFESDLMESYLYWIFVKEEDFKSIKKEFDRNTSLNVVGKIVKKKGYHLSVNKTHYFIPTSINDETKLLSVPRETPALLHLQITYKEVGKNGVSDIEPIELLIGKHLGEISVAGFVSDSKSHEESYYSKMVDNYLPVEHKNFFIDQNKKLHYPFLQFEKNFKQEYSLPQKLIRIPIVADNQCNYECVFCCYGNGNTKHRLITEDELRTFLNEARSSGYEKAMFTGGEPLLLNKELLLPLVRTAVDIMGEDDFWITTNGSLLTSNLVDDLIHSGLRRINVSIPSSREKYLDCVNPKNERLIEQYDIIKDNISYAITKGINVRVDIPINAVGAKSFEDLEEIINDFRSVGVTYFSYFPIHKTKDNSNVFDNLYIDPHRITYRIHTSDRWRVWKDEKNGMTYYVSKDGIRILIGADPYPITNMCKSYKCGHYCQGTYASYLFADDKGLFIRACHREFGDNRNIFRISPNEIKNKRIATIIKKAMSYANKN